MRMPKKWIHVNEIVFSVLSKAMKLVSEAGVMTSDITLPRLIKIPNIDRIVIAFNFILTKWLKAIVDFEVFKSNHWIPLTSNK